MDDEQDVLVKILVEIEEETHFHQVIDQAPDFHMSNALLGQYMEIEGATIRTWHLDPSSVEVPPPTHEGSMLIH